MGSMTQNSVNLYLLSICTVSQYKKLQLSGIIRKEVLFHIGKFSRYLKLIPLNARLILTISIFKLFKTCNTFPCSLKQRVINIMSLILDYWGLNCTHFIVPLLHSTTLCIQQNSQAGVVCSGLLPFIQNCRQNAL